MTMRTEEFKTDEDKKLEMLLKMDSSLLEASRLARYYFGFDLKGSIIFLMKLYKDFHGVEHRQAKEFGL